MLPFFSRLNRATRTKTRGRSTSKARRPSYRPRLEVLEDRYLLSTFEVVLATDNGGPAGQKVSATTGDLRYCVEQADAAHTATTDSIGFSSALTSPPHTITLNSANGPLVLSDSNPLTINGPNARTITVSGGDQIEVFDISGGTVSIRNLIISHGSAVNGGGIFNQGNLSLTDCFFDHDSASLNGGGIFNPGTAKLKSCTLSFDSASGSGGGMDTSGTASLTNCTVSNDSTGGAGGGIENEFAAALTLSGCTFSNDSASLYGGGVNNNGTITLTGCTLSNDTAPFAGGGISSNGLLFLTNCTLNNNSCPNGDGGAINNNFSIDTLTNCTLNNNSAGRFGGGIINTGSITLTNCTLDNDSAPNASGGGIENFNQANLTNCTISNGSAQYGGGINNDGTVTVTGCTLSYNTAFIAGGGLSSGFQVFLTNCTLSHNFSSGNGGGIHNAFAMRLTNCTLSLNSANGNGGGIFNDAGTTLNLTNTIVAGDNAAISSPDIYNLGAITADHDLIGDGTGSGISNGGGNLVGGNGSPVIDPMLGPLQNNGGPTQTMALLPGSPAIGMADNSAAPGKDQRGVIRIDEAGETTDIGAFEL